ncbi:MAG: TraB/GumN family protein [Gammaproteobacteria bacterium]|nr:TraB/GumN family protein [Gammaproteobacteria bacterium]
MNNASGAVPINEIHDKSIYPMQINTFPGHMAKLSLLPAVALLLLLSWTTLAFADQANPVYQAEIRYIDRSKGERNQAIPVTQPVPGNVYTQAQQANSPFLWRIEHPGNHNGARSNYIFGTIHIDDEKVMTLPDSVRQRLIVADTLMLELELNANGSVDVLRKMLFTDGRNLMQVIGEEEFSEVSTALIKTGNDLPDDVMTFLKPWAAMLMLVKPENNSGTFLDKKLAELARDSGIRVLGLETANEQLSVFDDIAIDDQVILLQSAMDSLAEKEQAYRQLLDAYLSGDMEKLVSITDSQQPKDKRIADLINEKLIIERNHRMFERMQGQLRAGNTFIAVGALHLPGEQGLLNNLRQAGYRLIRIEQNQ